MHVCLFCIECSRCACARAAEGRVVSRAAGGTPLPLLPPPRRAAASAPPAPPPPAHSPADIMQMPIVFADDDATGTYRALLKTTYCIVVVMPHADSRNLPILEMNTS